MVDRETRSVISQSTRVDRVSKYFKSSKLRGSLREKWAEPIVMGSPFCFVAGFFERRRNELEGNGLGIVSKFLELERFEGGEEWERDN